MGTVRNLLNRVRSFNVIRAAGTAMKANETEILEINKEQLQEGKNSDNEPVGFYRSVGYALYKNKRNPKAGYGTVDLKDTGDFYRSFTLTINGNVYTISATDSKMPELVSKYSPKIFGFMEENKIKVWMAFRNDFINEFKKHCKL